MPRRGKHRRADRRDEAGLEQAREAAEQAQRDLDAAQQQHTEARGIAATLRAIRRENHLADRIRGAIDGGGEQ